MEIKAIDVVVEGLFDVIRKNSSVEIDKIATHENCKEAIQNYLLHVIASFMIHGKEIFEN